MYTFGQVTYGGRLLDSDGYDLGAIVSIIIAVDAYISVTGCHGGGDRHDIFNLCAAIEHEAAIQKTFCLTVTAYCQLKFSYALGGIVNDPDLGKGCVAYIDRIGHIQIHAEGLRNFNAAIDYGIAVFIPYKQSYM